MSESLLYLDQCSSAEAMRLLADAARQHKLLDGVCLIFPVRSLRRLVTIVIQDPTRKKRLKPVEEARARCHQTLLEGFRALRSLEPASEETPGEKMELAPGLTRLIMESGDAPGEGAEQFGDHLILGYGMKPERARQLFFELSSGVTAMKVGAASGCFLFHVMDDHQRKSAFQSFLTGGVLSDCRVLAAYGVGEQKLFLPIDTDPGAVVLQHFLTLVETIPSLFGLAEKGEHPLHLALDGYKDKQGVRQMRMLDLSRLELHEDFMFTPPPGEKVQFRSISLKHDANALRDLWSRLQKTDRGYRLSLRRTRVKETGERERLRLEEQMAEVRYKLAYLDSIHRPRPILLRFNATQLPALADLLRAMPVDSINDGNLLYAFRASHDEPAGLHYLMFDPGKVILHDLDPLILWEEQDAPVIRFWLDPLWARHYHHQETQSLICVPHGTTLDPPMHDWDRQGMDQYLRKVMGRWFRNVEEAGHIPVRPIYLFDGRDGRDQIINITVLDQESFKPIGTRLGWITDNLVLSEGLGMETFIGAMADHETRRLLADTIETRAGSASKRLETMAEEVSRNMAATVEVMTRTLSQELNKVADETHDMVSRVREIRKELKEWEKAEAEMKDLAREIRRRKVDLTGKSEESKTRFREMEERVKRQLGSSRRKRMRLLSDINSEVQGLREAREHIRDAMFNLKIWE